MIRTYTGSIYYGGADYPYTYWYVLRSAVSLLTTYAGYTVVDLTDNDSKYEAILHVGGRLHVRLYTSNSPKSLSVDIGYYSNNAFHSVRQLSSSDINYITSGQARYAELTTINSEIAVLKIKVYRTDTGYSGNSFVWLRTLPLKSSIDGRKWYCGYVERLDVSAAPKGFPLTTAAERVFPQTSNYFMLNYTVAGSTKYTVSAGNLLLFPTLIGITLPWAEYLGVPTVDGETPYFIAAPDGVTIPPYQEFELDGTRWVSLGNIAIKSR